MSDDSTVSPTPTPTDEEVVQTAAEAAEGVVLSQYKQSAVQDLDVTVTFESGTLEVDVYLNPPEESEHDPDTVVDDAVTAATDAVDSLFEAD